MREQGNLFLIARRQRTAGIDCLRLAQRLACQLQFSILNIDQCQKLPSPDKIGITTHDFLELDHCQIETVLSAIGDNLIVFARQLIDLFLFRRIFFRLFEILGCPVFLVLVSFADQPLTDSRHTLTHLIVDQSQQISGVRIDFIVLQTQTQVCNRP